MDPKYEDTLMHYGTKRHSGRYPWGSGDSPFQSSGDFASRVQQLRKEGLSDKDIAKMVGVDSSTQLRIEYRIAKNERRAYEVQSIKSLQEKGYNTSEIARALGYKNESSVRSLLNEHSEERMNQAKGTAEYLKQQIAEKKAVDVGIGVERELNVSKPKMDEALYLLRREGYEIYGIGMPQVTNPGKQTIQQILCPPGTTYQDVYNMDPADIQSVTDHRTRDDGVTFTPAFTYPASMDSKRIKIRYNEEGGLEKDGLVELRRGVPDLDLGESHYAQVRILVDDKHYIKGMAIPADDLPDGVDLVFNTNKAKGTPMKDVLKPITDDPTNPFGSLIKEKGGQSYYQDEKGNKKLSLINKRAEEGDWEDWDDTLPSQFLAKQSKSLIKKQIGLSIADKQAEFEEICAYNNPTVKRKLLEDFANECDSTAVHLDAAALPRQKWHVMIPVTTMKDTEIYAPRYEDGEKVALVRYPHGGTFEIPILTVNNKRATAKKILGNAPDAVALNKKVADRLSGADFDGDTVMLIPTHDHAGKVKITSQAPLKQLENFDAHMEYAYHPGIKTMKKGSIQKEMGTISNLITDMTLKGAPNSEIAKAVKHSMVVVDAYKHKLDYKQSEIDNDIDYLSEKYQGVTENGKHHRGAGTLISRAKSDYSVAERQGQPRIDPDTGELVYKNSGRTKTTILKNGTVKVEPRMTRSTKMAEVKDAHELSTGHPVEEIYADYANKMKSMANQARKEMLATGRLKASSAAKETYQKEVAHLDSQLNISKLNAPREREAQRIANSKIKAKEMDNPGMTKKDRKKAANNELIAARQVVGAKRTPITISEREWEAIQAGAVSDNKLSEILIFADPTVVKQYATPRSYKSITPARLAKIKSMNASNYTLKQIAEAVGCSESVVTASLKGKE